MKYRFSITDRRAHAIEGCLDAQDYESLVLGSDLHLKAAYLHGYRLDRFRRDFASCGREFPALVQLFDSCRSVIITRPGGELILYGDPGVARFDYLWSRMRRHDLTALNDLESVSAPAAA